MASSNNTGAAARQVHDTTELQEIILPEMDIKDIAENLQDSTLLAQVKASSKLQKKLTENLLTRDPVYILDRLHSNNGLQYLVKRSHELQQKLYLRHLPSWPNGRGNSNSFQTAYWIPNHMLCPQQHTGVRTNHRLGLPAKPATPKLLSIGANHYELSLIDEGAQFTAGGRYEDEPEYVGWDLRFSYKSYLQYTLNVGVRRQYPELPAEYLKTHLSDRAEPVILNLIGGNDKSRRPLRKALWIPPGTTLHKILHFADLWAMGMIKEGGILHGVYIWHQLTEDESWYICSLWTTSEEYLDICERGALVRYEWRMIPRAAREEFLKKDAEQAAAMAAR